MEQHYIVSIKMPALWTRLFFVYVSIATFLGGVLSLRTMNSYVVSEWLLNYQGGFVRRGLAGQLLLTLAHTLHVPVVRLAPIIPLSCYAVIIFSIYKLVRDLQPRFWLAACLVSPAFISFQIFHLNAGYRKELVFLAILTALASHLHRFSRRPILLCGALCVALPAAVLSSEIAVFYMPYVVAILMLSYKNVKSVVIICLLPLLFATLAAAVSARHPGDAKAAYQICESLGYPVTSNTPSVCTDGAAGFLMKTAADAHAHTLSDMSTYHYWRVFPLFGLFALVPLVGLSLTSAVHRTSLFTVWAAGLVSLLCSFVLFAYAVDWGRWISIHIMCLTVLLIVASKVSFPDYALFNSPVVTLKPSPSKVILLAVYGLCWALPCNLDGSPIRLGYMGRVVQVIHAHHEHLALTAGN